MKTRPMKRAHWQCDEAVDSAAVRRNFLDGDSERENSQGRFISAPFFVRPPACSEWTRASAQ
jgi:hypothetical protein